MFLCFLPIILRPSSSSWPFGNLYENMVCNKEIFITPILLNLEIVFVLSVRFGAPLPSPLHSNLVNNFSMLCVPILYFSSSLLIFVLVWKAGINEKVAVCLSCSFYPQEEYSAIALGNMSWEGNISYYFLRGRKIIFVFCIYNIELIHAAKEMWKKRMLYS